MDNLTCQGCGAAIKSTTFICKSCGKTVAQAEVASKKFRDTPFNSAMMLLGVLVWVGALIALPVGCVAYLMHDDSKEEIAEAQQKKAEQAERRRNGFHCTVPLLGYSPQFVEAVKQRLRDPDSFEHDETLITPVANGKHEIIMRYRAKNGFGGINRSTAVGTLAHDGCTVLSIQFG